MTEKQGPLQNPDLARLARTIFMVGAVMLLVGLFFFSLAQQKPLYQPQNIVVLTLRIGGILLMATAGICRLGKPIGVLLDTIVSGIIGIVLIVAGLLWWSQVGWLALMVVLFGFLSLNSAWGSGRDYQRLQYRHEQQIDHNQPTSDRNTPPEMDRLSKIQQRKQADSASEQPSSQERE